jgi:phenylpyruvate tautomerase PptA (4-oxalocrotonate tautomerase family)
MAHIDSVEALDKFMGSSDATPAEAAQVKAIIDKVPEHPTPAEKAHAVKEVAEAVGRLNRRQKQHLIEQVTRVNKITEDFNTMVMKDESAQFAGTEFESMYHSFHTDLQDSNGLDIAEFSRIHNLKDAIAAQTIITRMLHTVLGGQRLFIVAQKGPIISKVKLLEKQVAIAGKRGNSAEEAQFRKDLTACKIFLSLTTRLAKQIETCDEGLKQISTTIMRLFGMAHA